MKVRIVIETGHAAFEDNGVGPEVARILHDLAAKLADDAALAVGRRGKLYDYNGNAVGDFKVAR